MSYRYCRHLGSATLTRRTLLKLGVAALAAPSFTLEAAVAQTSGSPLLKLGVVLPVPTGNPSVTDDLAAAAQAGALLGESLGGDAPPDVLLSSSPTAAATRRAAERLVTLEEVSALVGGTTTAQAAALRQVAEAAGVLFFNVGTSADAFQDYATPNTFHVEASASTYLEALFSWFAEHNRQRWFLVSSNAAASRTLYQSASRALVLTEGSAEESEHVEVAQGIDAYASYPDVIERIRNVRPDVVLLLLQAEDSDFFLSQYGYANLDVPVTSFSDQRSQTRAAYTRVLQAAPQAGAGYRATLWDATLRGLSARTLNESFLARTGMLMEAPSWAAYTAVSILHAAAAATATTESDVLRAYFESQEASFDVHKGRPAAFEPRFHRLQQPLYVVKLRTSDDLSTNVASQRRLAQEVGEVIRK